MEHANIPCDAVPKLGNGERAEGQPAGVETGEGAKDERELEKGDW